MYVLSQNKKIIITSLSIFALSFVFFLFYFSTAEMNTSDLHNDSMQTFGSHGEKAKNDDSNETFEHSLDESELWFSTTVEGKFLRLSPRFCEILNSSCENLEGKLLYHFINPKDLPELVSSNIKLFQNKEKIEAMGPFRIVKGRKEALMLFETSLLIDETGKIVEVLFLARDLTDQVEEMREGKRDWIEEYYFDLEDQMPPSGGEEEHLDDEETRMVVSRKK